MKGPPEGLERCQRRLSRARVCERCLNHSYEKQTAARVGPPCEKTDPPHLVGPRVGARMLAALVLSLSAAAPRRAAGLGRRRPGRCRAPREGWMDHADRHARTKGHVVCLPCASRGSRGDVRHARCGSGSGWWRPKAQCRKTCASPRRTRRSACLLRRMCVRTFPRSAAGRVGLRASTPMLGPAARRERVHGAIS